MTGGISASVLPDELIQSARCKPIEDVISPFVAFDQKLSNPHRRDYWACCPFHSERSASFHVNARDGYFKCFGCGARGDGIRFVMAYLKLSFPAAIEQILGQSFNDSVRRRAERERHRRDQEAAKKFVIKDACRRQRRGLNILSRARPAKDSAVELYLLSRGINLNSIGWPSDLGTINGLEYYIGEKDQSARLIGRWPAMVGTVRDANGHPVAAHVTFIERDGHSKAEIIHPETGELLPNKRMYGPAKGGAIRLYPAAVELALGEGIETALSARMEEPELSVWSALSRDNLVGGSLGHGLRDRRRPGASLLSDIPDPDNPHLVVPDQVRTVLILADNDVADDLNNSQLIRRGIRKFEAMGKSVGVVWPPKGMDCNDLVRNG